MWRGSDCTIVTVTAVKGGSMITADLANGYHKDVFALPGRVTDFKSTGTNWLIKNNQATLLENAQDLVWMMGWAEREIPNIKIQESITIRLNEVEHRIVDLLRKGSACISSLLMQQLVIQIAGMRVHYWSWK